MAALLGFVEHELPDEHEVEDIHDILRELGNLEAWPPDVGGPSRVLRFLRGSSGNKVEAAALMKDMLTWRSQEVRFRVDDLRASTVGFDLDRFQKHYAAKPERRYLPGAFLGRSRKGAVVAYYKAGAWDAEGLMQKFGDKALVRHEVEKLEWLMWFLHKCYEDEKRVQYLLVLLDLEGAKMGQVRGRARQALVECSKNLSNYYRDSVELTIAINTPFMFRAVWALISPFMTERQKKKLRLLGSSTDEANLAALHATISPELLPASLGGTAIVDIWGEQTHTQAFNEAQPVAETDKQLFRQRVYSCVLSSCCIARGDKSPQSNDVANAGSRVATPRRESNVTSSHRAATSRGAVDASSFYATILVCCCIVALAMMAKNSDVCKGFLY